MPDQEQFVDPNPLEGIANPWEFLRIIREKVPKQDRPQYLNQWADLVAQEEELERDALMNQGREVFSYTMGTMRESMKKRVAEKRPKAEQDTRASVCEEGILAEQVYRPNEEKQVGFLVMKLDRPDEPLQFVEQIKLRNRTVYPFPARVVEAHTYLPSGVEEYGTDWDIYKALNDYVKTFVQTGRANIRTMGIAYIMTTWLMDNFYALPYFRVLGDFGVGKSRILNVLGLACYRPILAAGSLTESAIFRLADSFRSTLVIDEADFDGGSDLWHGIIKVLNVGYERKGAVYRTERDNVDGAFVPVKYNCFGPKLLATRRTYRDSALESRCITHNLPVMDIDDRIPVFLDQEFEEAVAKLRNKLLLWRFRHWGRTTINSRQRFKREKKNKQGKMETEVMENRINQIILPVLEVAKTQPQMHTEILKEAWVLSDKIRAGRKESYDGRVLDTGLYVWEHRADGSERSAIKTVTERLKNFDDYTDISGQKVGAIFRAAGIETFRFKRDNYFRISETIFADLNGRYGSGDE